MIIKFLRIKVIWQIYFVLYIFVTYNKIIIRKEDFSKKLTLISVYTFYIAIELTTVILPPMFRTIKSRTSVFCTKLKEIICPQIEEIDEYTFLNWVELKKIKVSSSVKVIKMWTFSFYRKLSLRIHLLWLMLRN